MRAPDVEMICTNWGCSKTFQSDRNDKKVCVYHPGRFEFGSEHGLWPEGWTCCRGEWDAPGCTTDVHRGQPKASQAKFCINHGEPNPKSTYPDSFCGKLFIVDGSGKPIDEDTCHYHQGHYIVKNKKSGDGVWSCCGAEERDGSSCVKGAHRAVEYPDEEAKKYFYDKPAIGNIQDKRAEFEAYGRFCGVFRKTEAYQTRTKRPAHKLSADEEKKMNLKDKICLNWACGKIFRNVTNHKRACKCHPGKWDFGYSSKNVSDGASGGDPSELLWPPHWSCCRGTWDSEGCRRTLHRGEFLDTYSQKPPRY